MDGRTPLRRTTVKRKGVTSLASDEVPTARQRVTRTRAGLAQLMAMYPAADVPVVQLSMPSLAPEALLTLGRRLRALREEGDRIWFGDSIRSLQVT